MSQFQDLMRRLQAGVVPNAPAGETSEATQDSRETPAATTAQADGPIDWRAIFLEILKVEGYEANVDRDNDILFRYDGWNLCLMFDANDSEYFRLVLPNFWAIRDEKERARAERAADRVNRRVKVAKVHSSSNDNMWVVVEMFVADLRQTLPVLQRCIRLLPEAARRFTAIMDSFD